MANTTPKHLQPVRLYYMGGFVKEQPMVSAKGNVYKVPPVGEYLEVPRLIANDLIRRNRNPQGVSVFTDDKRFADIVIAARNRGEVQTTVAPREYSREELLEMLAAVDAENEEVNSKTSRSKTNKEIA